MREEYIGKTPREVYDEKVDGLTDRERSLYKDVSEQAEYLAKSTPGGERVFKGLIVNTLFSTPLAPELHALTAWYLGFIAGVTFAGLTIAEDPESDWDGDPVIDAAEELIERGAAKYDQMMDEALRRNASDIRFGQEPEPTVYGEDEDGGAFRIDPRGW